jgi:mRNA interferase ChpB
MGAGLLTQGVVICDQPRTLDFAARDATFVERVPDFVIEEVLTRS